MAYAIFLYSANCGQRSRFGYTIHVLYTCRAGFHSTSNDYSHLSGNVLIGPLITFWTADSIVESQELACVLLVKSINFSFSSLPTPSFFLSFSLPFSLYFCQLPWAHDLSVRVWLTVSFNLNWKLAVTSFRFSRLRSSACYPHTTQRIRPSKAPHFLCLIEPKSDSLDHQPPFDLCLQKEVWRLFDFLFRVS